MSILPAKWVFATRRFRTWILVILATLLVLESLFPAAIARAASAHWDFSTSSDYIFDSSKIEIADSQARLKATADWYDPDWGYRIPILIDNSGNAETLTDYQVLVDLDSANFDFSKANADGSDIWFADSDGITPIQFRIENYDSAGETARIRLQLLSIPASASKTIYMYYGGADLEDFRVSVDPTIHDDYGLMYPVTYEFSIPAGSSSLKAYRRFAKDQGWVQITEKTSSDYFNGIETVRFDYPNNRAYVSVAFDSTSDDTFVKITDASGQPVDITYQGVPEYYDNRDAVVTATGDDWDGRTDGTHDGFLAACDAFSSRQMWFTAGIITQGNRKGDYLPVNWGEVQPKLNAGYTEAASHSREHLGDGIINYQYAGTHTGADGEPTTLTDSSTSLPVVGRGLVGWEIENTSDGSSCVITANTETTVTCSEGLSGGIRNVWDNGDTYLIDQYDEEIGGSKDDIINNLDLPGLYTKGDQEYVLAWQAPYGASNATMRQKIGENKYIVDRSAASGHNSFADAVFRDGHYRVGGSLWYTANLETLNNAFDAVVATGGIYHLMDHPSAGDWNPGGVGAQHLDYIKEKTNLWYVGFGHLYLYHYLEDQFKLITAGGDDRIPFYQLGDDFLESTLNTDYWTEEFRGGDGVVRIDSGNAILDPEDNVTNSAAIKSTQDGYKRLKTRIKSTDASKPYLTIGIGYGDLVSTGGGWYYTTFSNGYVIRITSNTLVELYRFINGTAFNLQTRSDLTLDLLNFHEYELSVSDAGISVKRDGEVIMSHSDTTHQSGYGLIAAGEYLSGLGDTAVIDWVRLSDQEIPDSEPSVTVASHESLYPADDPVIRPVAAASQNYASLSSFTETATKDGGEIKYQISNNSGETWYWWNGASWSQTAQGYAEANTASEVDANIQSFPAGEGLFTLRAYLHSDGSQQVSLSSVEIGYELPLEPPTAQISSAAGAPVCGDKAPSSAPWVVAATATGPKSILVSFMKAGDPVDRYAIEYGTQPGNYTFAADNIGGADATSSEVAGLRPSTTYYFRVRGGNGCATGAWSAEISATTRSPFPISRLETKITEIETRPGEEEPAQEQETKEEERVRYYDLTVRVVDQEKTAVEGARVTLSSTPREAVTNAEGIVSFDDVEEGEHLLAFEYRGARGEQKINLSGDEKEIDFTIKITLVNPFASPAVVGVGAVLVVTIAALAVWIFRLKRLSPRA